MLKTAGICAALLICILVLRSYNKTFAVIVTILGCALLFACISDKASQVISFVGSITQSAGGAAEYIKLMLKILGIILTAQFLADICRDNGEGTLASLSEFSAKIIVLALVLPLFDSVIKIVTELVK